MRRPWVPRFAPTKTPAYRRRVAAIRIDTRDLPLLRVEWPDGVSTGDIDAHFEEMAILLSGRARVGVLMNVRAALFMPAGHRKRIAERIAELAKRGLASRVVAVAHVTSSHVAKGVLTAVYWLAPPPFPTRVFGTLAEGERWVRSVLEADE